MLKSLAKSIFAPIILKKAFLIYNRIRDKTIDRVLYPELTIPLDNFASYRQLNPFLAADIQVEIYPPEIQYGLRLWTDPQWKQDEYLLHFKKSGYIDGETGWALTNNHKLIYPSLGFSRALYVKKPDIVATYFKTRSKISLGKIISLRDTGEENYFHFFNDVLSKLFFLRNKGIALNDFTIVISEKLYYKEFFQHFFVHSWIRDLTWHVQSGERVYFSEAIFSKPLTHTKEFFAESIRLMHISSEHGKSRRIFLTRSRKSLRYIENDDAILNVLNRHGFETVDPGEIPFHRQAEVLSQCRFLIGIHGAGLTNMMFRYGSPLSVLEIIHPFEYIPFHYIMMAKQFNFSYHVILGKKGNESSQGGFYLDPSQFELAINNLLNGET